MSRLILRYGIYSAAILTVFLLFIMFSANGSKSYNQQEKLIFIGVFFAFMMAFPAIRALRINYPEKKSKFINSLSLTLAIFLFPSVCYGLIDVIYWEIINPEFSASYYAEFEQRIKMGIPEEQVDKAMQELRQQQNTFNNPYSHFMWIFGSVYLIGIFVSIPITALGIQIWKAK